MLEKLLERLKEVESLFETGMANLNALNGAKQELQGLINWHQQQPADLTGEVV